jgi:hypothetical protein
MPPLLCCRLRLPDFTPLPRHAICCCACYDARRFAMATLLPLRRIFFHAGFRRLRFRHFSMPLLTLFIIDCRFRLICHYFDFRLLFTLSMIIADAAMPLFSFISLSLFFAITLPLFLSPALPPPCFRHYFIIDYYYFIIEIQPLLIHCHYFPPLCFSLRFDIIMPLR